MDLDGDPEDILSSSLQSLYDVRPITFTTAGSVFTYDIKPGRVPHPVKQIQVATPDTDPSNWALHASSIWVSSLFIADHLEELHIDAMARPMTTTHTQASNSEPTDPPPVVRILELGAGTGLPSIVLAHMYPHAVSITASDYPDDRLIRTLSDNVRRNALSARSCSVVPYVWGTDVQALVHHGAGLYDVVFAADTLWNPELHAPFVETLCGCLRRGPDARVHLVAGLHTGRYTIQSFLDRTRARGLVVESVTEREVDGTLSRLWDMSRAENEDEQERRRWVVWIILKWGDCSIAKL